MQTETAAGALKLVEQRGHQLGTRATERVTEGDGTAVYVYLAHVGSQFFRPGQHDRCERLIDFEQVDVVDGHAGLFEDLLGGRDRTLQHGDGVGTGQRERMKTGTRLHAEFLCLVRAHDQHCRCTIADLRGVACGDQAIFLKSRLQCGQRLNGRAVPHTLVAGGHAVLDWYRDDLVVEATLGRRYDSALLALRSEGIEVFAAEAVLDGNHVSAYTLRGQAGGFVAIEHFLREGKAHVLHDGRPHGHACHDFDTGSDHDVVRAGHHALGGEMHRLLAGATLPVHRGCRYRFRPSCG